MRENSTTPQPNGVRVWDLPTRLFHWTLVVLVVFSFITAEIGGNAMDWHMRSGYAILTLVLFRVLWGLAGSHHARFVNFVRHPREALRQARDLLAGGGERHAGHSPLAALSVLALLASLGLQAITGLFANDDIATEGPLARFVSDATSHLLTKLHEMNQGVLYALIALHLAAIAYCFFVKRENLVKPMITGDKRGLDARPIDDGPLLRLRALVLVALAGGLVAYVVSL